MKTAEQTYIDAYEDEVQSFIGRVEDRAQVRIQNAMKELEEVRHTCIYKITILALSSLPGSCISNSNSSQNNIYDN